MIGGVAIIASIIGALVGADQIRPRRGRPLPGHDRLRGPLDRRLLPDHQLADERPACGSASSAGADAVSVTDLWLCAVIGVAVTGAAVRDHRLLHVDPLPPGEDDRPGLRDRARDQHHPGARSGLPVDRGPGAGAGAGDPRRQRARRDLRHRRRRDGAALALRADRRPRRLRADHRQRRRDRRDGRPARGRAQRHRPARRGRQHDQGGHQGLRDRLGRARGAGAVRRLQERTRRARRRTTSTSTGSSTCPAPMC